MTFNPEEKFLIQYQKYHTSSSPLPDYFLKKIISSDKIDIEYAPFFNTCFEHKLDVLPAICHILKEFPTDSKNINSFIFHSTINYFIGEVYQHKIKLSDDNIKTICDAKLRFKTNSELLKCNFTQLNFLSLIKNEETKKQFVLEKISKILNFSDDLSVQKKVLKSWNSMSLNGPEIENFVPVFFNKKKFFSVQEQKIFNVEIDCNKLAHDLGETSSNHIKKMCLNFILDYEKNNLDNIIFSQENKTSQITVYFNDENHVQKFKFFLDHFSAKMGITFKSDEPNTFLISFAKEWSTVEQQYQLEKTLDVKSCQFKKLKI